jgi:phenylalanyl-tRNA synthetase beta chain
MSAKGLISDVNIFDVYMGEHLNENEKSVALKVTYTSFDATLTDKIIKENEEKIITVMNVKFGAKLRG